LTAPGPTVLAIETDSAWVVILVVSLATLALTWLLRSMIRAPGGLASGILLALPLALPLLAAVVFTHAVLPEISVWQPIGRALRDAPTELLHLLLVADRGSRTVVPYALSGSAGQWMLLIGVAASSLMLLRRAFGAAMVRRLIARSVPLEATEHRALGPRLHDLAVKSTLNGRVEILVLPDGVPGAFALGTRTRRILLGRELLTSLEEDELAAIAAHEFAHLEANDVTLVFVAGLLRDLVAWNPVGHLAYRRLMADRELEADGRAADLTGNPLAVASGLLKVCKMMRAARYRHRVSLAFLSEGGGVKRRVASLIAAADGRISLAPSGLMPYAVAAALVAVLGLQVGARVAQDSPGAVMIMWGTPDSSDRTWSPDESRALRGGQSQLPAALPPQVEQVRPRVYGGPAGAGAVRLRDVPEWFAAMDRWTEKQRAEFIRMRWKSRQNWEATPLFAHSSGPIDVYRLVPHPF